MNKSVSPATAQSVEEWNQAIAGLPGAHLLQTWEWGVIKEKYNWNTYPLLWTDSQKQIQAAALILQRAISIRGFASRLNVLYVPRGPVLRDWSDETWRKQVMDDLQNFAHQKGAIFIKIDPEIISGTGIPDTPEAQETETGRHFLNDLQKRGWLFSDDQIQFRNTVWLSLEGTEEDWLSRMKQKARYNLRLSQRKGVVIREGKIADFPLLYKMYAETSLRDHFAIRSEAYYQTVWQTFMQKNMAVPLLAEVEGEVIAGLFLFFFAGKAWYLYGMSTEKHRDRMPNYLLQWEAMRHAKAHGCSVYDLWGAPDVFDENDSMWGVFRFKQGLGGEVIRTPGAWDYPARPFYYALYTRILPRILDVMRNRGISKTRSRYQSA